MIQQLYAVGTVCLRDQHQPCICAFTFASHISSLMHVFRRQSCGLIRSLGVAEDRKLNERCVFVSGNG